MKNKTNKNPMAKALQTKIFHAKVIKPKKGKGSYKRDGRATAHYHFVV